MRRPWRWFPAFALFIICAHVAPALAGGVGISAPPEDSAMTQGTGLPTFYRFRPGTVGTHRYRDLEFWWDSLYTSPATGDTGLARTDQLTLDKLGYILADSTGHNPFTAGLTDIRLVHDYFSPSSAVYDNNPFHLIGFQIGPAEQDTCYPAYCGPVPVPALERAHLDHYIFVSGHSNQYGGQSQSFFFTAKEDSSTGHWFSDSLFSIFHGNSIMYPGPWPTLHARTDTTGTGWTRPDGQADWGFCHEFQHSVSDQNPNWRTEMFSSGAEAVAGNADTAVVYEVPFTWPLTRYSNYQGWRLFSAYLAYNFLGADRSPTLDGFKDDVLYRWSRTQRHIGALRDLLADSLCADCSAKNYFHPGGLPLDTASRMQLLLHNWRVASYVNDTTLAEGQYGYPPRFGFTPVRDVGAWRRIDGIQDDDAVAIPPEVTARRAWRTRDTTMVGTRTWAGASAQMQLDIFGSEYWVVRSDTSLAQSMQDLVVRVSAENILRKIGADPESTEACAQLDGRLVASVVPYSPPADSVAQGLLFAHPDWARQPLDPVWVDLDSFPASLEFVIPGFGTSYKAAVIVMSLGDGPSQTFSRDYNSPWISSRYLPYRLSLALRAAPYDSLTPRPLTGTAGQPDERPCWSPSGNEVAFHARIPSTSPYQQIYRQRLDGSGPVRLVASNRDQSDPDWSPRGDWVAFAQDSGAPARSDLVTYNPATAQLRTAVAGSLRLRLPAFSPDGQQLVFASEAAGNPTLWQLRRVSLDGSGSVILVQSGSAFGRVRWSTDGTALYFTRNDTLYSVGPDGGTVARRDNLLPRVAAFDFHPGHGQLLAEQPCNFRYKRSCTAGDSADMPVRRLALRDPASGDVQIRFYRTGAEFFDPRWSPDGTRAAFSSDQNNAGDRDLFVGQVSFDHAPSFSGLEDRQVTQGTPFNMDLSASDPDGETITFEAPSRYLPAGSSLTGSHFHWDVPPNSAGQEYYVVFRALDGSNGLASRVVKFTVVEGGGSPFVDTRTAAGWEIENSILGRSLASSLALDDYRIKAAPDTTGGHIALRIRENEQEYTTLDQVRLVAVDHAAALSAFALGDRVVLGTRRPAARVTTAAGAVITALVDGSGGFFVGEPGETLTVELGGSAPSGSFGVNRAQEGDEFIIDDGGKNPPPPGAFALREARPLSAESVDAQVLGASGILFQVPDGAGWRTVVHHYPRERFDETVLDSLGSGTVRLVFVGRHQVRFLGRLDLTADGPLGQKLPLLSARHSRLGDVQQAIEVSGNLTTALAPGDTLELSFGWPTVPPGQIRDLFLLSRGVYTSNLPAAPQQTEELPARFALAQNQPNPFATATTIRFDLPVACDVRLEVFDLQGRRMQTLARGRYEAGYRAVNWDRRAADGRRIEAGVYLYRLIAGPFRAKRKLVILP